MALTKKKIERIKQSYSGLGQLVGELPFSLSFYHCKHWRNMVMSPNFLSNRRVSSADLKMLETYFGHFKVRGTYEGNKPRLSFFKDSYYDTRGLNKVLAKESWKKIEGEHVINIWEKPIPFQLPKGYSFRVARYFDPKVYKDFSRMMKENFSANKQFLSELDRMHKTIEKHLLTVVIYNTKGKAVGAGLVATGEKRASFLYCGSISKLYRKKGLWNLLVAIRQSISNSGPGHIWTTTTFNPHIMSKGQYSKRIISFYKP